MKFSVSTQSFWEAGNPSIPDDCVDITDSEYVVFFTAVNSNKLIYQTDEGLGISEIKPSPYHSFDSKTEAWVINSYGEAELKAGLISDAEAEKQRRIDEANAYINGKQWPSKLALGRLSDTAKAEFNLWLDYLDALAIIDTSSAPDISWPIMPAT